MRITSIEVAGVRGMPDRQLDLSKREEAEPPRIVALAGTPGCGKTRLLEAIAAAKECAAPYGQLPSSAGWAPEGGNAKVKTTWWLDEDERSFAGLVGTSATVETVFTDDKLPQTSGDPGLRAVLGRYEHRSTVGKVDYLDADRRIPPFASRAANLVLDQKQRRMTRDEGKYATLPQYVADLFRNEPERVNEVRELFSALSRGRRLLGLDERGRLQFDSRAGQPVGLRQLPRSDEMAFLLAASVAMVGLRRSVVLFDAPELHFPPGDAARLLAELVAFTPTTQWIVASHDPAITTMADMVVALEAA